MYLENLRNFMKYYGQEKKIKLLGFLGLSLFSGCLELIGVAMVYPFILLIIQPDAINITKYVHIENTTFLGLIVGLSVFLIFIFKNSFIILIQYIQSKFVSNWRIQIVNKFMQYFIYAPYKNTMKISQSDKLYIVGTVIGEVIGGFVIRSLNLLTNIVIISMIIILLLIKFPIPAIISIVFVCVSMTIQNKYFKERTANLAKDITEKSREFNNIQIQNVYNIKELKILTAESMFFNNYTKHISELNKIQILQGFYASIPPYIVEILVVCSLLVMAFLLSIQKMDNNTELIASFAIIVAALFRVAPALNRIQSAIIGINTSRNFVKYLNDLYIQFDLENFKINEYKSTDRLPFRNKIKLENITFSYTENKPVIKNFSVEINKGDFIGIIGLSGAGKSTLADIITGLLPADSGSIYVDNTKLTKENFPKFRRLIGYVPQQINIMDKSFKENVAWGCDKIDEEGVIKALKAACLYEHICQYSDGINSNVIVGSNGLSQGQKQRLAIARALYRDPEILIFDEATSALDVQVENEITETITKISSSKTIIAIAHRLSTLKACNKLIYIADGKLVDVGTFEELSNRYEDFANLVKLSSINQT